MRGKNRVLKFIALLLVKVCALIVLHCWSTLTQNEC